ncbi:MULTISPECIES: TIGR03086 family metal-binding protein [unclassified Nocardioides]|uniref:TIGR03086 family metal-binding protein n=1 Tax=unclassified Nocardioides TaxID=2615069 RepID=UPI0009F0C496|nr:MULTISPECIES: TIGR03086 family metal-binding protein [unclassified Nocardioides]GAW50235.1 uncharacterized protein PD653B2_2566 [Nocardioides sp. PD653-B2]GAW53116.1 uncharacterized protein PD653_0514 [Nocardioides sp. PD653]
MRATLDGSVELLDRALSYTLLRLAGVRDDLLDRPTPCAGWSLADLLAHLDDALDAFTEAAGGRVEVHAPGAVGHVAAIEEKACALLGAWSGPRPGDVVISDRDGGLDLGSPLLVATAALEVTVHGWDVGQSTGAATALPDELARALLPVARAVVGPGDRGVRFAPARAVDADASYGVRLLAFLGRSPA